MRLNGFKFAGAGFFIKTVKEFFVGFVNIYGFAGASLKPTITFKPDRYGSLGKMLDPAVKNLYAVFNGGALSKI